MAANQNTSCPNVEEDAIRLDGLFCPFPVVCVVRTASDMSPGEMKKFIVDDPMAIKSIPEELEVFDGVTCSIKACDEGWEITVTKE